MDSARDCAWKASWAILNLSLSAIWQASAQTRNSEGEETCRSEANEINHAVDKGVDFCIDLFVPLLLDTIEKLCRVLVY